MRTTIRYKIRKITITSVISRIHVSFNNYKEFNVIGIISNVAENQTETMKLDVEFVKVKLNSRKINLFSVALFLISELIKLITRPPTKILQKA